ncbi:MAG: CDP-alcohol phosphatidyltransferase family protein [Polyangiaceae bacterium]
MLTDSGAVPADPAARRLQGTVWQGVPLAHIGYSWIRAFGAILGRSGISANTLTLVALALSGLAAATTATGHLWSAATLVLIAGVFDALDGVVARATGTTSKFGALLDSTVDRFSDALPLIGVLFIYLDHGVLALVPVATLVLAFGVSYVRARAEGLGARLPPLFMRRAERTVMMILCLAVGGLIPGDAIPYPVLLVGVGVIGALSSGGLLAALLAARRALDTADRAK